MWMGQVVWFICVVVCTVCALSCQPLGGLSQYKLRSALSIHIISSSWGLLSHCAYTHTVKPSYVLNQGAVLHLDKCLSVVSLSGKPDPEQSLPGRVQGHSEDDREGYSGHWPGSVHEVSTKRQAQMEIWVERVGEGGRGKKKKSVWAEGRDWRLVSILTGEC